METLSIRKTHANEAVGLNVVPEGFRNLRQLIGNTPMIAIHCRFNGKRRVVYAKAEHLSMTGSIKDRMAFYILKKAYRDGVIKAGDTVVEATSGNSGISFAAIGRALGHKVEIYMPDWMSRERAALIKSLGATVIPVSKEEGGFLGCIRMTQECARRRSDVFLPSQFANQANVEAHQTTTGPEVWYQLHSQSLRTDAFVAGVGTGGTIMGVGRFLKNQHPGVKVHPLEPLESPTLSTGFKVGQHRIQGISDEFIPAIVDMTNLDEILSVSDGDAILMAQKLATGMGLAVGTSSGANFLGALIAQERLGSDAVVVTVFPDDNKKYLSTDLLCDEPVKAEYLAPRIELEKYEALRRVCYTCFDAGDDIMSNI